MNTSLIVTALILLSILLILWVLSMVSRNLRAHNNTLLFLLDKVEALEVKQKYLIEQDYHTKQALKKLDI